MKDPVLLRGALMTAVAQRGRDPSSSSCCKQQGESRRRWSPNPLLPQGGNPQISWILAVGMGALPNRRVLCSERGRRDSRGAHQFTPLRSVRACVCAGGERRARSSCGSPRVCRVVCWFGVSPPPARGPSSWGALRRGCPVAQPEGGGTRGCCLIAAGRCGSTAGTARR